jgi:hypothetical protein
VLEDLLREGAGTVVGRWYVTLFGVVFVAVHWSHLRTERASESSGERVRLAEPR